jgi:hypothetical protein
MQAKKRRTYYVNCAYACGIPARVQPGKVVPIATYTPGEMYTSYSWSRATQAKNMVQIHECWGTTDRDDASVFVWKKRNITHSSNEIIASQGDSLVVIFRWK